MIKFSNEVDLKPFNTFGISATASVFVEADEAAELAELVRSLHINSPVLLLGGGSNILFVSERCPIVYRPAIKGIEVLSQTDADVLVRAGAGEVWDEFVCWCVKNGYAGLENLSHIPGTVGACPIQNIGAYGAEAKETIEKVETIEVATGQVVTFNNKQCLFGYRDSFFKQNKGKCIITAVCFRLSKIFVPNLTYRDLQTELTHETDITIGKVRQAVINIRSRKLPDTAELGNAGSFFKNPTISNNKLQSLRKIDPLLSVYPVTEEFSKISAAWLIRQCGWSGKRHVSVGVHKHQPLVIVNYGDATGKEIVDFADRISDSIRKRFDIELEKEVNIV